MKASSILAVLLLVSSLCSAQELARYELSGGVSYGGIDTSDVRSPKGFAGSFATNVNRWLSMETSVGAQFDTQTAVISGSTVSLNTGFYSFLSGPRISYRRGRVVPFGHGLFGWARSLDYGKATYNPSNLTFSVPYGNTLGAAAGGGVDYWITRRIALRAQGDYFLTQPDGTLGFHMTNNFRLVGGIVFSFGSTPTMTARMSRPRTPATPRRTQPDVIAKETPQTAAPKPASAPAAPTQASIQPMNQPAQPAQPAPAVAISPSAVVAKQSSTPAKTAVQPASQPSQIPGTTIIQSSAVVAKQTPTAAPVSTATVAPKQDPFTPPAKPASAVVNNSPAPAPAPAATAVLRPPAAAAPQADPQPFSLGEYARKLREKKESHPKDWN